MYIRRSWPMVLVVLVVALVLDPARPAGGQPLPEASCAVQTLTVGQDDATPPFDGPVGAAIDGDGNLWAAVIGTATVQRFDPSGAQTLAIGAADAAPPFAEPFDVAADAAGNAYVVDQATNTAYRFDDEGNQTLAIGGFDLPTGIAVDGAGMIYVAAPGNGEILVFDPEGDLVLTVDDATPAFGSPTDVAVDGAGHIWVTDEDTNHLYAFDPAGNQIRSFPVSAATTPHVDTMVAVAADAAGNVYASSSSALYRFDATGNQTLFLPSTVTEPALQFAQGLDVDAAGTTLVVADDQGDALYRLDISDCTIDPAPQPLQPAPTAEPRPAAPDFTG